MQLWRKNKNTSRTNLSILCNVRIRREKKKDYQKYSFNVSMNQIFIYGNERTCMYQVKLFTNNKLIIIIHYDLYIHIYVHVYRNIYFFSFNPLSAEKYSWLKYFQKMKYFIASMNYIDRLYQVQLTINYNRCSPKQKKSFIHKKVKLLILSNNRHG